MLSNLSKFYEVVILIKKDKQKNFMQIIKNNWYKIYSKFIIILNLLIINGVIIIYWDYWRLAVKVNY